ncbi:MAG: hypothetical protein ABIL68_07540 [bacterium]
MKSWLIFLGVVVLSSTICDCSKRNKINPLDPGNPETDGKLSGLHVVSEKHTATLSWGAVDLEDVLGYSVYRKMEGEGKYGQVAFVAAGLSNYKDGNLDYERNVNYKVSVVVSGYESPLTDSVSITPGPYNYWIVDGYLGFIYRLTYDGLHVISKIQSVLYPYAAAADTTSETIWVVDTLGLLYKLSRTGETLLIIEDLLYPTHVTFDPSAGVVWVCDGYRTRIGRYDTDGNFLGMTTGFDEISDIDYAGDSGGCWVADLKGATVQLVSSSNSIQIRVEDSLESPRAISYFQRGGWLWVADGSRLLRIWPDGRMEEAVDTGLILLCVSTDQTTGDCWAVLESDDGNENAVCKFRVDGYVAAKVEGFRYVESLAANDFNGGCLAADMMNGWIVRISNEGEVLSVFTGLRRPWDIAVE